MSAAKQIEWGGKIGGVDGSYGRARRRLYKKQRKPARLAAVGLNAPLELPDAKPDEVSSALFHFCEKAGIIIGDAVDYDALRDEYTCIAKDLAASKVKDIKVQGSLVAMLISFFRQLRSHQRARQSRLGMLAI
jgi:hypothetical protein